MLNENLVNLKKKTVREVLKTISAVRE